MKKVIDKVKYAFTEQPKLVVILLVLVLFLTSFIIFRIADKYMNNNTHETSSVYMYLNNYKEEFEADISINRKKVINDLTPKKDIGLSSNPVYSKNRIIFPKEMIVYLPVTNGLYHSLSYTYLDLETNNLIMKDFNSNLEHYIIYDGKFVYFFNDEGSLIIDGTSINLGKYTTVVYDNGEVTYYDYSNDKGETFPVNTSLLYELNYITFDIKNNQVVSSEMLLPSSTESLPLLSKLEK